MKTFIEKIAHSKKLIEMAYSNYEKIAVFVSWGKDSMSTLFLVREVDPDVLCTFVNTPFIPKETLEFRDLVVKHWNLNYKEIESRKKVPKDFYKINPDECCRILKVEPVKEILKELDCWITGLRVASSLREYDFQEIEYDENIVKLNPILKWTELDVWRFIAFNQIPVHPWYKKGYRSLGCAPCTKIIPDGLPERDGRWYGTSKCGKECGIHTIYKKM